jgi:hypothetical protein
MAKRKKKRSRRFGDAAKKKLFAMAARTCAKKKLKGDAFRKCMRTVMKKPFVGPSGRRMTETEFWAMVD